MDELRSAVRMYDFMGGMGPGTLVLCPPESAPELTDPRFAAPVICQVAAPVTVAGLQQQPWFGKRFSHIVIHRFPHLPAGVVELLKACLEEGGVLTWAVTTSSRRPVSRLAFFLNIVNRSVLNTLHTVGFSRSACFVVMPALSRPVFVVDCEPAVSRGFFVNDALAQRKAVGKIAKLFLALSGFAPRLHASYVVHARQ